MPRVMTWFSVLLTAVAALAQSAVPPPPRPADSGPSLQVTMKFIQDKLNDQGTINFIVYVHDDEKGTDWTFRRTLVESNFVADPAQCRISFHWKVVTNGQTDQDKDGWFDLKAVQSIAVMTKEQNLKIIDTNAGKLGWSYRVDPPVSVVIAYRSRTNTNEFDFHDEDTANRVAKALTHAVELCGGGQNEPF